MLRTMCRVKIHRARVNEASLNYIGSMTIPSDLMRKLDILEGEQVDVVNVQTGARWTTYAISGKKKRHFCLNGAAARLGAPGDILILMLYAQMDEAEARGHRIQVAHMRPDNSVARIVRGFPGRTARGRGPGFGRPVRKPIPAP